jgi:hypothetical protein
VRIGKRGFEARVKGELRLEFGTEKLTSHAGLELVHRFLRQSGFLAMLRATARKLSFAGDLSFATLVRLVVGMLVVGAKRLRHLAFVGDDPLLQRFAGVSRTPTERSLGRALRRMSWRVWPALDRLSRWLVREGVQGLGLRRWTVDIDGSVLTTGLQVERAERGFNPHHRKNPSYYPILATLAQTGHVLCHRNTEATSMTRIAVRSSCKTRCARCEASWGLRVSSRREWTQPFSSANSSKPATGNASSTR